MALINWIADGEEVEDGVANRPLRGFLAILNLDPDGDITGVPWLSITGKPTTLAGYGITDAAALVHVHAAADVTSGQFAMARLASGTPTGAKFIRDDGTLQIPSGGVPGAHTHDWADITGEPTTLAGYGITDAYTDAEVDTLLATKAAAAHTHNVPNDITPGVGAADFNVLQQDGVNMKLQPFRVENRTSDPGAPAVGQIWLRTDL